MHVGEHRNVYRQLFDFIEHAQAGAQPRAAIAFDRGAVGLVVRGLENKLRADFVRHRLELSRHARRQPAAPGEPERGPSAQRSECNSAKRLERPSL